MENRDALIEAAYLGPLTMSDLMREFITSADTIRRVWKPAIADGRLPATRPCFAAASGVLKDEAAEIDYETMSAEDFERVEREEAAREAIRQQSNRLSCDALLAALIRAHGRPRKFSTGAILPPVTVAPDIAEGGFRAPAAEHRA